MNKKKNFDNLYSNLESNEETKKYIKEMQEMEDKNEKKNNMVFASIAIPLVLVAAFTVKQITSITINMVKNDSKIEESQKNIAINSSTEGEASKENTSTASTTEASASNEALNTKLYTYLSDKTNRTTSFDEAKALNKGSEKGLSTIFIAEILRNNGYEVPNSIINTKSLVSELDEDGWKKIDDYSKLEKGDIVFTTLSKTSKAPTHVYIFMGWVEEGKTDYANICDSQVSEYSDTLHERNIDFSTTKKDKFNYFMRKE